MPTQTNSHSRPHGPHLLQFLLLSLLAIVTNSMDVPLQAVDRETGTSGQFSKANIMISAQCRFGHEVGCSIPVYVADGRRSRKELLLPPSRIIKRQPRVNSLSRDTNSRSTHISESPSYLDHGLNLKSDSTSVSIASRRQVLSLERGYPGNRLGRKLAQISPHVRDDLQKENSHLFLEDSEFIPIDTNGPHVNISNRVEHWKAPSLESGPLVTMSVSQWGAADFSSIQKAVDSVPARNTQRVIIRIHAGNYREKITVPYNKPFITFHGDENGGTVVSWNATASSSDYAREYEISDTQFARIENTSASLLGTLRSASVTILSDGFVAQHMVFQNTAPPPEPGAVGAQAVAFLIGGDRAAFYYCSFLGAQDTLYDYTGRHYYLNCYIEGSIDFIFGNGRSLFEGCHLHSIAKSFGAIAAHQRLSPEDDTGFSFDRCTVTGSGTLYLGRAWSPYARIVFARTYFDNIISAEGWSDFGDPRRQSTTFFGQYQCTGPGANLSHRAPWAKLLTDNDVLPYLGLNFVNGKQWLGVWPMGPVQNGTGT